MQLENFRAAYLKRAPLSASVQDLVNDGVVAHVAVEQNVRAALLLVRQAAVLQFTAGLTSGIRAERAVVVADRAPARTDGTDRRYLPGTCAAAVRRMFGAQPQWIVPDPGVRAALRTVDAGLDVAERDLPTALAPPGWVADRTAATPGVAVAGVDLCDAADWPSDVADLLAVGARLPDADIRVRLPDRPRDEPAVELPGGWLGFPAADLEPRPFLHQLDFYLHFPAESAAGHYSRPALEAAAMGCVVVMPERFAGFYGDAAVYCAPDEVGPLVARYRADPVLFAEQSRRARTVVAKVHDPAVFVEHITALLAAVPSADAVTVGAEAALPMP